MEYDLVIIGAGPAGLSAALTAAYLRLKTVVLEAVAAGGLLAHNYPWKEVDGYLGFYGLHGKELSAKLVEHVRKEGVEVVEAAMVQELKPGTMLEVRTDNKTYKAKAVILAVGCMGCYRRLGVPGEYDDGVYYYLKDPKEHKGKKILVVGGGDTAVETAFNLDKVGVKVTIIHRKEEFRANEKNQGNLRKSKAIIMFNTEVKEIIGKGKVEKVRLYNNKKLEETTVPFDEVFVCIGTVPNSEFLGKLGAKTDENCNLVIDTDLRTNVKGMFAAGDVTGRLKRISWAVGEGSKAAFSAFKYIKNPYWK